MNWLAFRTQRLMALVAVIVVAIFAIWLAVTGSHSQSAYATLLHHDCFRNGKQTFQCNQLFRKYSSTIEWNNADLFILYAIPCLLGLLLGAPLVAREIEHNTNRLAWTQSISRTRWLVVKLTIGGLITAAIMGSLVPLADWWVGAAQEGPNIYPRAFDILGIVPIAYGLFAFMLGAALGAIIRRTGWSIAAGIPLFAGLRLLVERNRYQFASARYIVGANFYSANSNNVAWLINQGAVPKGRLNPAPGQNWNSLNQELFSCTSRFAQGNVSIDKFNSAVTHCSILLRLHEVTQYQPGSHFWQIQIVEFAVFIAAIAILLGVTVFAVRRWRT